MHIITAPKMTAVKQRRRKMDARHASQARDRAGRTCPNGTKVAPKMANTCAVRLVQLSPGFGGSARDNKIQLGAESVPHADGMLATISGHLGAAAPADFRAWTAPKETRRLAEHSMGISLLGSGDAGLGRMMRPWSQRTAPASKWRHRRRRCGRSCCSLCARNNVASRFAQCQSDNSASPAALSQLECKLHHSLYRSTVESFPTIPN